MMIGTVLLCAAAIASDGDSFRCGEQRIRLHAIDGPERREPYGKQATRVLSNILNDGPVECYVVEMDRYGRAVSDCLTEAGVDIGRLLVLYGAANHCPAYGRDDYAVLPVNQHLLPLERYCGSGQ